MKKTVNEKLVDWIRKKAETEYVDDIGIVALYGSFVNGTANPKSDVDCYFIPKTERGYQFAKTFILGDIGYDIFPMSWERIENIVDLKESLLPLVADAKIIYYNSEKDLQKFQNLQFKLKENLKDKQMTYKIAEEKIKKAYDLYRCILHSENLTLVRKNAGLIIMILADAVAFYNHTYYHYGLKRQFSDLKYLAPREICEEYLNVIYGKTIEEILFHCEMMIQNVCDYINTKIPEEEPEKINEPKNSSVQADFSASATLYEELCSTFNKIYVCCKKEDVVLAYLSAVCLQEDLDYAHDCFGAKEYRVLQSFDAKDLGTLNRNTKKIENDFVNWIIEGKGIIKKFDCFEELEQA
mgnify:CR=1 FL=1|nr:nucleotidyltransferase domain-containing protein [uncultured Sellimonas sp.]